MTDPHGEILWSDFLTDTKYFEIWSPWGNLQKNWGKSSSQCWLFSDCSEHYNPRAQPLFITLGSGSLIIKSRKLERTVSFNPPAMSDITAADPSQSRLQQRNTRAHTRVWNLLQLFSTARRSGLSSLDASAFWEWDDWRSRWYDSEPIHEKLPLRRLQL